MANDLYVYDEENDEYYKLAYTGPEVDEALGRILSQKFISNICKGYVGFETGWSIIAVGDSLLQSMSDIFLMSNDAQNVSGNKNVSDDSIHEANIESEIDDPTNAVKTKDTDDPEYIIISGGWTAVDGGYISDQIDVPLDMPVKFPAISGSIDKDNASIVRSNSASSGTITNGTRARFRVFSPTMLPTPYNFVVRLIVASRRRKPPEAPPFREINSSGDKNNNLGVLGIAKSYLNARVNSGRKYSYGKNWTYSVDKHVNDSEGRALMECDTLITMVMLGIPYSASPYAHGRISNGYGPSDLLYYKDEGRYGDPESGEVAVFKANPTNEYPWANSNASWIIKTNDKYTNALGKLITNTSAQNWWGWDNYCIFSNKKYVRKGDLAIFRRSDSRGFDNIGHIGVIDIVDGELSVIHVTIPEYTDGNIIVKEKLTLDEFYSRGRYDEEDTYFLRPNCPQKEPYDKGYQVVLDGVTYESTVDGNTYRIATEDLSASNWKVAGDEE